jgi:methionyl aminopeptidase
VADVEAYDEPPRELVEAGRVAARARDYSVRLVRPGESCRRICEAVEEYIRSLGAQPAFPCNISINEVAAHYTPGLRDDCTVPERGIVKVDVGAAVEGYIADTAVSVPLSDGDEKLVEAAREALEAVMKIIKPGIRLYEIGRTVESVARRRGFRPIKNLSGHSIGRYVIHAGLTIPNYADRTVWLKRLTPGLIVAIEPFITNGKGYVVEHSTVNIYAYKGRRPKTLLTGMEEAVLSEVERRFKTMPFTPRWLARLGEPEAVEEAVRSLAAKGALHAYPVLVEAGRGLVAQAEHTFYVAKDRVYVVTLAGGSEGI